MIHSKTQHLLWHRVKPKQELGLPKKTVNNFNNLKQRLAASICVKLYMLSMCSNFLLPLLALGN